MAGTGTSMAATSKPSFDEEDALGLPIQQGCHRCCRRWSDISQHFQVVVRGWGNTIATQMATVSGDRRPDAAEASVASREILLDILVHKSEVQNMQVPNCSDVCGLMVQVHVLQLLHVGASTSEDCLQIVQHRNHANPADQIITQSRSGCTLNWL